MRGLRSCLVASVAVALVSGVGQGGPIGPVKWSQPPVVHDPGPPPTYLGWNQLSQAYELFQLTADDFECTDPRPVVGVHWWGSYIGLAGAGAPGAAPSCGV